MVENLTETTEPQAPTEEEVARLHALNWQAGFLRDWLDEVENEQAELTDKVLTHGENLETNLITIGPHIITIGVGYRMVNWQRECKRLASPEAIQRIKEHAPRVPTVTIESP